MRNAGLDEPQAGIKIAGRNINYLRYAGDATYLGSEKNKVCHCFHCFPIYCHEVMGLDAMILVF